jgi:hypothetical protein
MRCSDKFAVFSRSTLLCALILFASGCGSGIELGKVTGRITKNGKPQPNLLICFSPGQGRRGSEGFTDEDGHYTLIYTTDKYGAVLGSQRVTITTEKNPGKNLLSKDVEVASGPNTFDFDLAQAVDQESQKAK